MALSILTSVLLCLVSAAAAASETHDTHGGQEVPLLFIFTCLAIGVAVREIVKRIKGNVPYTVLLLLVGFSLGTGRYAPGDDEVFGVFGDSLQVNVNMDPHLILHVFIPALIFESAFSVNFHIFRREVLQAAMLAGPGIVLSAVLTGIVAKTVFPYDWSWATSFLFGAIVSATDPVAVVSTLRELGASKRLATLIEAESLLNDGSAFVAFLVLKDIVIGEAVTFGGVVGTLCQLTLGGLAWGVLMGTLTVTMLTRTFNDARIETVTTITAAYLTFWIAESGDGLQVSGVLAVVAAGLTLSRSKSSISPAIEQTVHHVWEMISYMANTIIFILSGAIVAQRLFEPNNSSIQRSDFGYAIVIYIFLNVIRGFTLVVLFPLIQWSGGEGYKISKKDGLVVWWGALRGAVGLSLALLVELEDDAFIAPSVKDRIIFHTAAAVFLTLLINGTSMKFILNHLGLDAKSNANRVVYERALDHLKHEESLLTRALKQQPNYAGADWKAIAGILPQYKAAKTKKLLASESSNLRYGASNESLDAAEARAMHIELQPVAGRQHHRDSDDGRMLSPLPHDLHSPAAGDTTENMRTKTLTRIRRMTKMLGGPDDQSERSMTLVDRVTMHRRVLLEEQRAIAKQLEDLDRTERLYQEVNHRFISTMKASYWTQYEEGIINTEAVDRLVEAAETALDNDDSATQFALIEPYLCIPWWFNYFNRCFYSGSATSERCLGSLSLGQCFQGIFRRWMYNHMSLGMQMAAAFLHASEKVDKVVEQFPQLPPSEAEVVNEVLREFKKHEARIRNMWLELQSSYAEVYQAIQTRNAARYLLHEARKGVTSLYKDGVLDESEFSRMKLLVDKKLHLLHLGDTFSHRLSTGEEVVSSLAIFDHLTSHQRDGIVRRCVKRTFDSGEDIITSGDLVNSIYVVTRGIVDMIIDDKVVEVVSMGRMIGTWSLLSNTEYLATARAHGIVEAFILDRKMVEHLCARYEKIEGKLWRMGGAALIRNYFPDVFGNLSSVELAKFCENAMYYHVTDHDYVLDIPTTALLLTGECVSTISRPDDSAVTPSSMFSESENDSVSDVDVVEERRRDRRQRKNSTNSERRKDKQPKKKLSKSRRNSRSGKPSRSFSLINPRRKSRDRTAQEQHREDRERGENVEKARRLSQLRQQLTSINHETKVGDVPAGIKLPPRAFDTVTGFERVASHQLLGQLTNDSPEDDGNVSAHSMPSRLQPAGDDPIVSMPDIPAPDVVLNRDGTVATTTVGSGSSNGVTTNDSPEHAPPLSPVSRLSARRNLSNLSVRVGADSKGDKAHAESVEVPQANGTSSDMSGRGNDGDDDNDEEDDAVAGIQRNNSQTFRFTMARGLREEDTCLNLDLKFEEGRSPTLAARGKGAPVKAPCILYPAPEFMHYEFSKDSRLLIFIEPLMKMTRAASNGPSAPAPQDCAPPPLSRQGSLRAMSPRAPSVVGAGLGSPPKPHQRQVSGITLQSRRPVNGLSPRIWDTPIINAPQPDDTPVMYHVHKQDPKMNVLATPPQPGGVLESHLRSSSKYSGERIVIDAKSGEGMRRVPLRRRYSTSDAGAAAAAAAASAAHANMLTSESGDHLASPNGQNLPLSPHSARSPHARHHRHAHRKKHHHHTPHHPPNLARGITPLHVAPGINRRSTLKPQVKAIVSNKFERRMSRVGSLRHLNLSGSDDRSARQPPQTVPMAHAAEHVHKAEEAVAKREEQERLSDLTPRRRRQSF